MPDLELREAAQWWQDTVDATRPQAPTLNLAPSAVGDSQRWAPARRRLVPMTAVALAAACAAAALMIPGHGGSAGVPMPGRAADVALVVRYPTAEHGPGQHPSAATVRTWLHARECKGWRLIAEVAGQQAVTELHLLIARRQAASAIAIAQQRLPDAHVAEISQQPAAAFNATPHGTVQALPQPC